MKYETFKRLVVDKLHSHFTEPKKITVQEITKNNGVKLDGLIILDKDLNIAPTIYLDYFFNRYENGLCFEDIFHEILDAYEESRPSTSVNVSFFTDFEKAKHKIVYKVINYEKNKELLSEIPYFPFLDLAIVFYCLVHSGTSGNASILIYHQHLTRWGITPDQLLELATKNTPLLLNYDLKNMEAILETDINLKHTDFHPMFVLTNTSKLNGACCILYKDLLKQIARHLESDFYILPSSIHEVILLPANDNSALKELSALVEEVNVMEVCEDEILSDHAYYFSRKENCVSM